MLLFAVPLLSTVAEAIALTVVTTVSAKLASDVYDAIVTDEEDDSD